MPQLPTKPDKYLLTMALSGEAAEEITTSYATVDLAERVNQIAKGLSIARFRGSVEFIILKNSIVEWTAAVTFSDDLPNGYWNTIKN